MHEQAVALAHLLVDAPRAAAAIGHAQHRDPPARAVGGVAAERVLAHDRLCARAERDRDVRARLPFGQRRAVGRPELQHHDVLRDRLAAENRQLEPARGLAAGGRIGHGGDGAVAQVRDHDTPAPAGAAPAAASALR